MSQKDAIKKYYTQTQFEYNLIWNWRLNSTPALHFGYYDEKASNHAQAVFRANEVLAAFGGIPKGGTLVDAGCGLGNSAIWLAKNYDVNVIGITIVPKQVDTILKDLERNPLPNMQVMLADYLHMPFENSSVDIVWAMESVCHARNKEDFYKEAFRVLKPGGKILMAEYIRNCRPMPAAKEQLLDEVFQSWAIPDLDTIAEHENHAKNAGFKVFRSKDVTNNVLPSYRNLRAVCKRYSGLSSFLHTIRVISAVRHKNMLSSLKQADALEGEVFYYYHIVAEK